jgi:hypothetical protein
MIRIKMLGSALVAAVALSLASVASASAHEFIASKTGTTKATGTNTQVFTTPSGKVECTKLTATGKVAALKSKTEASTVKYSGCTAFGLAATISTAKYLFSAEGSVKVSNTITISIPSASCSVKVGPTGNSALKTISYVNKSGKIEVQASVSGITFTTTGGLCGSSGKTATYKGNALNALTGGTLEWK